MRREQVEPEHERIGFSAAPLEPVDRGFHACGRRPCSRRDRSGARPGCAGIAPTGFSRARESHHRHRAGAAPARPPVARRGREDRRAARADRIPDPEPRSPRQTPVRIPCRLRARSGTSEIKAVRTPLSQSKSGKIDFVRAKRRPALVGIGKPIPARSTSFAGWGAWSGFRENDGRKRSPRPPAGRGWASRSRDCHKHPENPGAGCCKPRR